jgi:hypothetical protein
MVANRALNCCAVFLASSMLLLSGCEDKEARDKAGEAFGASSKLDAKIAAINDKADALAKTLNAMREQLTTKLDTRVDAAVRDMDSRQKQFLEDVKSIAEKTMGESKHGTDDLRADYDKTFTAAKSAMAADIQKLRDEIKASNEDLRKFMDNQLKELYPYAYQPKRLDPNTPPAGEAK